MKFSTSILKLFTIFVARPEDRAVAKASSCIAQMLSSFNKAIQDSSKDPACAAYLLNKYSKEMIRMQWLLGAGLHKKLAQTHVDDEM
jgi:hypothetical protein